MRRTQLDGCAPLRRSCIFRFAGEVDLTPNRPPTLLSYHPENGAPPPESVTCYSPVTGQLPLPRLHWLLRICVFRSVFAVVFLALSHPAKPIPAQAPASPSGSTAQGPPS